MEKIVYHVVKHGDGWAYKLGDTISEAFRTHDAARAAALSAARRQNLPGKDAHITWEDEAGKWHEEYAHGEDRPQTDVEG
ncbi:DUF2188 domain-containing protein [Hyphomonas oceanitis]|jgi:hypothetical protein|uniref:DUF2188 domain-containing protein n=1 Tax=Hyphomonas oceanitis SCH89 TaxID=1280953 RepID=A0A059G8I3_9PROT|nr:DUF2188 domain-containing protein [Hyphomonas oceanitis]KDA03029.1 hypothetical protein HOC_07629 [Hyphomonas oceanitis SCH89]|tara:strand:- start:305134 stop:305373 length:240 start_codon:yes stop_codon:yes gene_type:complete